MGVCEEDEAPDARHAADEQAGGKHGAVGHAAAQPAHEEEAQDDLHPAQAVHHAVPQLTKAEVALSQRSHHGLRDRERERGKGIVNTLNTVSILYCSKCLLIYD